MKVSFLPELDSQDEPRTSHTERVTTFDEAMNSAYPVAVWRSMVTESTVDVDATIDATKLELTGGQMKKLKKAAATELAHFALKEDPACISAALTMLGEHRGWISVLRYAVRELLLEDSRPHIRHIGREMLKVIE